MTLSPSSPWGGRWHPVAVALVVAAGIGWWGFPGLLWDVAWHRTVGRDSFLSPPHVLMYAGVLTCGLVAAWALFLGRRRHGREAFGRLWIGGLPAGFALVGLGFLLAVAGAAFDEWWHLRVGKDVNLWSPPHLVGLGGTMLIALGLVLAVAGRTRYAAPDGWRPARLLLPLFFADLVHKATVALDHYTLDPWGRTPDFYPFVIALLQPAIFALAIRAVGPGGATATAALFALQHVAIVLVLLAAGMRTPTFTPLPLLPALAMDLVAFALGPGRALGAALSGLAFVGVMVPFEAAWMAWVVERPWEGGRVLAGLPAVALAGAGSAWVGWVVGGFVRSAAEDRPVTALFLRPRPRLALGLAGVLVVVGLGTAYRPSPSEPPASPASLALAPDTAFDYRDAVFWPALLPDGWQEPGVRRAYQEAIVDGRGVPLGPAWCAADEGALEAEWGQVRFALAINGEAVLLDGYPRVERRLRDGRACRWIAVSARAPRPGRQELVYTIQNGAGVSTVIVDLRIKAP
jgi:hypothetical protein